MIIAISEQIIIAEQHRPRDTLVDANPITCIAMQEISPSLSRCRAAPGKPIIGAVNICTTKWRGDAQRMILVILAGGKLLTSPHQRNGRLIKPVFAINSIYYLLRVCFDDAGSMPEAFSASAPSKTSASSPSRRASVSASPRRHGNEISTRERNIARNYWRNEAVLSPCRDGIDSVVDGALPR